MRFTGFPAAAFGFYEALAADNSRTFWKVHKDTYRTEVREPLDALLAELDDIGPFHVFRPYKDVRFAKDKTPYKDHQGAYSESEGGAGFYIQLSATGLMVATGYFAMANDQLVRFREAVDTEARGSEVAAITADLVRRGYGVGAIGELKTAPRGYPRDHPRIDLLRRKGLMVSRSWDRADWMSTRTVVRRIRDTWGGAAAINAWLDANVGPSTLAPDDDEVGRFGPL
jgi:uncharacterized protein (TIGR02453 family)